MEEVNFSSLKNDFLQKLKRKDTVISLFLLRKIVRKAPTVLCAKQGWRFLALSSRKIICTPWQVNKKAPDHILITTLASPRPTITCDLRNFLFYRPRYEYRLLFRTLESWGKKFNFSVLRSHQCY